MNTMPEAGDEEARWNRVLLQAACGVLSFLAVLLVTRLWTSVTNTRSQKRRHKSKVVQHGPLLLNP